MNGAGGRSGGYTPAQKRNPEEVVVGDRWLDRNEWEEITERFSRFFAGCGSVSASDDALSYDGAPLVATGLVIRSDGTSTSFMPLHGLEARWERVLFDGESGEVTLEAGEFRYAYRLPARPASPAQS